MAALRSFEWVQEPVRIEFPRVSPRVGLSVIRETYLGIDDDSRITKTQQQERFRLRPSTLSW